MNLRPSLSRLLLLAVVAALRPLPANGDVVGTADLTVDISGFPNFTGTLTFDNQSYPVSGCASVNLGTLGGTGMMTLSGSVSNFNGSSGNATAHVMSFPNPTVLTCDFSGSFICSPTGCTSGDPVSFVGDITNLMGTAFPFDPCLPANLAYTGDGTERANPPLSATFFGRFGLNAFQPQGTPASPPACTGSDCNVTVGADTTFFNSQTNTQVNVHIDVTYSEVASGGTTDITAVSNSAGKLSADFSLSDLPPTFFDVSTTAQVVGPITVCSHYPDADNNGIVDGTSVDENSLALLHCCDVNGFYVDVTTNRDTVNNLICGAVDSLSSFVVAQATRTTSTTTTTTSTTATTSTTTTTTTTTTSTTSSTATTTSTTTSITTTTTTTTTTSTTTTSTTTSSTTTTTKGRKCGQHDCAATLGGRTACGGGGLFGRAVKQAEADCARGCCSCAGGPPRPCTCSPCM